MTRTPATSKARPAGPRKARVRADWQGFKIAEPALRVYADHARAVLSGWSNGRVEGLISWIGEELRRRNEAGQLVPGLRPMYSRSEIIAGLVLALVLNEQRFVVRTGHCVEDFGDLLHREHRRLVDVELAARKVRRAQAFGGRLRKGVAKLPEAWAEAERIFRARARPGSLSVRNLRAELDHRGVTVSLDTAARMLKKFRPNR